MDKETQDIVLYYQYHIKSNIELISRVIGKNTALRELEQSFSKLIMVYEKLISHEIDIGPSSNPDDWKKIEGIIRQ